jgi:hypothetical protein
MQLRPLALAVQNRLLTPYLLLFQSFSVAPSIWRWLAAGVPQKGALTL